MEGDVAAGLHGGRAVVLLLGALQAAVDRLDDLFHGQAGVDVELGGVAHFDVADVFGDVVLGQFVGHPFEVFRGLQHGAGGPVF
jgi:hypothetical protein